MIGKPEILEVLKKIHEPKLKKDLVELGMIRNLMVEEGNVKLTLALTTLRCPLKNQMVDEIKQVVGALAGVSSVDVQLVAMSGEERKKYTIAVLIVKRIKTIQNNETSGLATARLQCKKGSSALNEP